jgi:DHA2 family methylenomycin A resistance protein-like MFS transporter
MTAVRPVVLTASLANFVVLADATIVVVALPSLGRDLGFPARGLPWVVNGYSLAFGCCLVLGGYAADRLGPRLPFVLGMALFPLGSLGCAAAGTPEALVLGRLVQGVGGALFSPAALAVVTASARDPAERARALAVWSAVGATAVAIGPVLGGALTGALGWRSVFWLPAVVCLVAVAGGMRSLRRPIPSAAARGFPVRRVAAACAVLGLASAAVVGAGYASTLWVQNGLHLTPAAAGLALLPLSAGIVVGAAGAPSLTRRRGERWVAVVGLAAGAAGTLLLVAATVLSAPLGLLLPASAVLAVGFGLQSVPVGALGTAVDRGRGLASAAYQTSGQLGGGLGLLALVGVAAWWSAGLAGGDRAVLAGYRAIFVAGSGLLLLAALVAAAGFGRQRQAPVSLGDRHVVDPDRAGHRVVPAVQEQLDPDDHPLAGRQPRGDRARRAEVGGAAVGGRPQPGVLSQRDAVVRQVRRQLVRDDHGDPVADRLPGDLPARRVGHPRQVVRRR